MEQLCYETLEKAGYTGYLLKNAPERVLQFDDGVALPTEGFGVERMDHAEQAT